MTIRSLILVSALLLGACDSGSSGSSGTSGPTVDTDAVQTGNFAHLRIAGLGYRTESIPLSITDEQGRFRFRAGETIEFYLGDHRIAQLTAEQRIALIDHLMPQLPDTAEALLAEVKTVYEISAFDALINTVHALLRLDEATQGDAIVVLPDAVNVDDALLSALAGPMQSLAADPAFEALLDAHGNIRALHYTDAIVWLYAQLERSIPSERTEQIHLRAPDGHVTITEYVHNSEGLIAQSRRYAETEPLKAQTTQFNWNADEQLSRVATGSAVTTFSYNNNGKPIAIEQVNGPLRSTDTYTYNEEGNLAERHLNVNGQTTLERYSYTTGPTTTRIDTFERYEEGTNPAPNSRELRVYDAQNLLLRKEIDHDFSGINDTVIDYAHDALRRLNKISQATFEEHRTYNSMGLLATRQMRAPDSQQVLSETLYEYDEQGRVIAEIQQQYSPAGEVVNTAERTFSYFGTRLEDGLHNLLNRPEDKLP